MTDRDNHCGVASYTIDGAVVETRHSEHEFHYEEPRAFQADALDWIHGDGEPVAAMCAPTGSGKTAVFGQLADEFRSVLILYPTNALIAQQKDVLSDLTGATVEVVTGEELTQTGASRMRELLDVTRTGVTLSNPDILQAALQARYVSLGREYDLFRSFDAVVYDEFHFYGALGASGLVQQVDAFHAHDGDLKILLSSATPDEGFVQYVKEQLETPVRRIWADSSPPRDSSVSATDSRFRHETAVVRHTDRLRDSFEAVAEILQRRLAEAEQTSDPRAAVIFNSAYVSNNFDTWLAREYSELHDHCETDNGYVTNADRSLADEFLILNTTSKGEVGLHFDLDTLVMAAPWPRTGDKFLQRAGRAGRESPATVHVFGLNDPQWDAEMTFSEFETAVYDTFRTPLADTDRLLTLVGIRSALAIEDREDDNSYHSPEMYDVFGRHTEVDRWRGFVRSVRSDLGGDDGGLVNPLEQSPDRDALAVCEFCDAAFDGLRSLRGETLDYTLEYPDGRETTQTSYDLVRALQQYRVTGYDEDTGVIRLDGETAGILVWYPGLDRRYDPRKKNTFDTFEARLTGEAHEFATDADWSTVETNQADVYRFLSVVPLRAALVPERVKAGAFCVERDENGWNADWCENL